MPRCSVRAEVLFFPVGRQTYLAAVHSGVRGAATFLVIPGSGSIDFDGLVGPNRPLLGLAEAMSACGYGVVRLSKIPYGEGFPPASYTEEYLEPVCRLVEAIRVAAQPLVLVGHSLGGHVAPLLANHIEDLAGLIIINPGVRSLTSIAVWQRERLERGSVPLSRAHAEAVAAPWPPSYRQGADAYNFASAMRAVTVPTLAISCMRDNVLPAAEGVLLRRALRENSNATLYRNRTANHLGMVSAAGGPIGEQEPGILDGRIMRRIEMWMRGALGLWGRR